MSENQSADDLRKRIALAESRNAIADLVHRYAFNIRNGTPDENADLFTEDAVFEMHVASPTNRANSVSNNVLSGRKAIIDYIGMTGRGDVRVYPLIYNLLIEITGDEAHSSAMMTARSWPGGNELMGEYRDSFRYENGWRFSKRVHTILRQPTAPS